MRRCIAAWEYCSRYGSTNFGIFGPKIVKTVVHKMPSMKSNETRSAAVSVGKFSKQDIVLVNRFDKNDVGM